MVLLAVRQDRNHTSPAHLAMTGLQRVASLLKHWLLDTHERGIQRQHLEHCLEELALRFSRRRTESPSPLFHRLIKRAIAATSQRPIRVWHLKAVR